MNRSAAALLLGLVLLLVAPSHGGAAEPEQFRIVGYLPYYRFNRLDEETAALLTDLVLFSATIQPSGELDMSRFHQAPWPTFRKLSTEHGVRLTLCVVNAAGGKGFPEMVASERLRSRFVKSAIEICNKHQLSGLDLDWEFPRTAAEQQAYADLMTELRQAFAAHNLSLTAAMSSYQKLPPEGFAALDQVHVMAYDHGRRHSTLQHAKSDTASFLERGVPKEKIVLGLPFYGRHVENRRRVMTYDRIVERHAPAADVDEVEGIYFNNTETIRAKTRHAHEQGFAGVMIWEIGQDARGDRSHVRTISQTVRQLQSK